MNLVTHCTSFYYINKIIKKAIFCFSNQWKYKDAKLILKEKPIGNRRKNSFTLPLQKENFLDPGPFY